MANEPRCTIQISYGLIWLISVNTQICSHGMQAKRPGAGRKHAGTFEEAATVFSDLEGLDWDDFLTLRLGGTLGKIRLLWRRTCSLLWFIQFRGSNMAKKQFVSSAPGRRHVKSARYMPDSKLDLNDIPEAPDEQLRRARRVGRPAT